MLKKIKKYYEEKRIQKIRGLGNSTLSKRDQEFANKYYLDLLKRRRGDFVDEYRFIGINDNVIKFLAENLEVGQGANGNTFRALFMRVLSDDMVDWFMQLGSNRAINSILETQELSNVQIDRYSSILGYHARKHTLTKTQVLSLRNIINIGIDNFNMNLLGRLQNLTEAERIIIKNNADWLAEDGNTMRGAKELLKQKKSAVVIRSRPIGPWETIHVYDVRRDEIYDNSVVRELCTFRNRVKHNYSMNSKNRNDLMNFIRRCEANRKVFCSKKRNNH